MQKFPFIILVLALNMQTWRTSNPAGMLLSLGTILFAADLVCRHYTSNALFPMSAPIGGLIMMAGWLAIAFGAIFREKRT